MESPHGPPKSSQSQQQQQSNSVSRQQQIAGVPGVEQQMTAMVLRRCNTSRRQPARGRGNSNNLLTVFSVAPSRRDDQQQLRARDQLSNRQLVSHLRYANTKRKRNTPHIYLYVTTQHIARERAAAGEGKEVSGAPLLTTETRVPRAT